MYRFGRVLGHGVLGDPVTGLLFSLYETLKDSAIPPA